MDDDLLLEELKSKKKKKKKKGLDVGLGIGPVDAPSAQAPALAIPEVPQPLVTAKDSDQTALVQETAPDTSAIVDDFDLPPKKKRRRRNIHFDDFGNAIIYEDEEKEEGLANGEDEEQVDTSPWAGQDRDYTYEELLERVFNIMREKNPTMVGGQKKKLVMKPPQVVRVGAKKTSFVNFTDICKMLHRQPKHLLAFLMSELGTSGSVDGNNQLIIKGKFQQKQIETVLRRYIKEYVTCHTCRSPDTILQKETRLFFLQCETCGSRCSVQSIKSGFQAVTAHRSQLRSKQQ